jgi:hypothetical protein
MTAEMIEKFIDTKTLKNNSVSIHFKQRDTIKGIFIVSNDYEELKEKNFWRVVSESKMQEWQKTNDSNLARIFNGALFTRLTN